MERLVVGVDGSADAGVALAWAAAWAAPLGMELDAVHVYVASQAEPLDWDRAHAERRRLLDSWCAPARRAGVVVHATVVDGEIGPALLHAAADVQAGAVVVAAREDVARPWLLMGSVADYVAHHAGVPVIVVPPTAEAHFPDTVILALDDSAGARQAAAWLAPLAAAGRSKVVATHIVTPPVLLARTPGGFRSRLESELAGPWIQPLHDAGVAVTTELLDAVEVGPAVIRLAMERRAGAIAVGTRRLSALRPLRMGGVTMELFHRSPMPVIAVPPTD